MAVVKILCEVQKPHFNKFNVSVPVTLINIRFFLNMEAVITSCVD